MATPLKSIAQKFPQTPGVYKMKGEDGTVIYVGKAKNLRSRVTSYFRPDYSHSSRTRKLLERVRDIEFTQTDTELEALLLENNIIKDLRPRYNILMKDDKSYVYIKVAMGEDFPRIRVVRERDMQPGHKVRYFGPKLATSKVYQTLRILKKLFPFRHCQLDITFKGKAESNDSTAIDSPAPNLQLVPNKNLVEVKNRVIDYPCLDYFIKRCPGPCIGAVAPIEYKKIVQQIIDFLSGKSDELEKSLKAQMAEAAQAKLFEKAARIRDKLLAIESISERQKITDPDRKDTDIINFVTELEHVYFNVFMVRDGKLINQENFTFDAMALDQKDAPAEIPEILESFLIQYYERAADIPKEILIPEELENKESLEAWLDTKKGSRVTILNPKRGEKNKLLELSLKNAISFSKQMRIKWLANEQKSQALSRLAEVLNMKDAKLKRIEGYDISHLGGDETVGSMVVFENGYSKSAHYRHFKLRTVQGKPDDYRSMEEVFTRRLKYLQKNTDVRIVKAHKKDSETIKKWGTDLHWQELMETPDWENFYMVQKDKKSIGMARLLKIKPGIFMVEAMYILPKHRGGFLSYMLMEKLISRIKNKKARIYIGAEKHLLDHWMTFGFVEINNAPEEVVKRNKYFDQLDNTKYTTLAYYQGKKKEADPSFTSRPDLIVVDGGKGQLSQAVKVLKTLKLDIPVISLAKRLEEIYVPNAEGPILLDEGDEALKLLQRIRDESHRFAITFQRELHRKALIQV